MAFKINSTKEYHMNRLNSLGWELTVCNALYPEDTPLRMMLSKNDSYGRLLYDYLSRWMPVEKIKKIIEIGGGYGYLMKDFLDRNRSLEPCMLDISPYLLEKQKETLGQYDVFYKEGDFLEIDPGMLAGFDLAVLNENLGDFPTLINMKHEIFQTSSKNADTTLKRALDLFEKYDFSLPEHETFNLNIGAIEALEKLCHSGVPYIYISEHSCEAVVPDTIRPLVRIESTGNPERIPLMGHDEYTIKFSYLQQVARALNYRNIRGSLADFLTFNMTDNLLFILSSGGRYSDEDEMICQFVEDLYKYEYLILIRQDAVI
jgi:hypothetical protein